MPLANRASKVPPVTDRALRYRANRTPPPGPRRCAFCGNPSARAEVGHVNGHEEDNSPANLIWTCRPCNVKTGNRLKAAGLSRLTRQYNPGQVEGAKTMGQWVNAVTSMKGEGGDMSVRDAVELIRATPARRRSQFAADIWHQRRMHGRRTVSKKNPAVDAAQYRLAQAVLHGKPRTKTSMSKAAAKELIEKTPAKLRSQFMKQNAGPKSWRKSKKAAHKRLGLHRKRTKRNPEQLAADVYAETHGKPATIETFIETPIKYHKNLAGWGRLEFLEIERLDGRGIVTVNGFGKSCMLAMNEKKDQLFITGGDQAVDLRKFGIAGAHEKEILGLCKAVGYYTEKKHLVDKDGGRGTYVHKFGVTFKNGRHVKDPGAELPTIVYDVRNKLLSFAGGSYRIKAEGIDG